MGQSLTDLQAKFRAREKSVVLLPDGGLLAEHESLTRLLEEETKRPRTSLADDGSVAKEIAAKVQDLEARIADSAVTIRVRGLGRNAFRRLLEKHKGEDSAWDDDFPFALVAACSLDPVMTEDDARSLADILTDGQWDEVFDAAFSACREVDGIPFNVLASLTTQI